MLRMFTALIFLGSVVAWSATADPIAAPAAKALAGRTLFLYDFSRSKAVPVYGELLPSRVYVKFEPYWKQWVYVRTDNAAKFTEPLEALLPGTVTPAAMIGASGNHGYRLTAKGTWTRSAEPEQYWLRVRDDLPTLKLVAAAAETGKRSQRKHGPSAEH